MKGGKNQTKTNKQQQQNPPKTQPLNLSIITDEFRKGEEIVCR